MDQRPRRKFSRPPGKRRAHEHKLSSAAVANPKPLCPDPGAPLPAVWVKSAVRHPLLYRRRLVREENAKPGDLVAVYVDGENTLMGYGLYNPRSEFAVRMIRYGADLPDAAFWTGGKAWQMARGKVVEADRFGLGPNDQNVRGWWFIRERLQLDLAALNKVELLCWDGTDRLSEKNSADQALLDQMAELMQNPDTTTLRERCATDPQWQIPTTVTCYHPMVGPGFDVAVA